MKVRIVPDAAARSGVDVGADTGAAAGFHSAAELGRCSVPLLPSHAGGR
ncbi:hypothetical protein ACQEVS_32335 [Streptomyces sp. CA-181903]